MKIFIKKLVQLADGLDNLGLKKDADKLDQLVAKAAKGEDFSDLISLFDAPVDFEDNEDTGPGEEKVVLDEPEVHTPLEEEEAPLENERPTKLTLWNEGVGVNPGEGGKVDKTDRLKELMRRHELLKLKQKLEQVEKEEVLDAEKASDEVKLPIATPEELKSFEDEEDDDVAVNEVDDNSLVDKLKEVLKGAPELASKLLQLVKNNPELLELLAL